MASRHAYIDEYFDHVFLKVLDKVLKDTLGGAAAKAIFRHLESRHSLRRVDIPKNIKVFTDVMEDILGSSRITLEMIVMRELCLKLDLDETGVVCFSTLNKLRDKFRRRYLKELESRGIFTTYDDPQSLL